MFNSFTSFVYIPSDLSAEAKTIISKNMNPTFPASILHQGLGKDLVNYLNRPELIAEVFNQIFFNYNSGDFSFVAEFFVDTMTDYQIRELAGVYSGYNLLFQMASILMNVQPTPDTERIKKSIRLSMKIQRNLLPNASSAAKQSAGEIVPNNTGISDRFGSGHDGIHIRAPKEGGQVVTIKALEGIVIRQYLQEAPRKDNGFLTLYAVWILLRDGKVAVYKDLKTIDSKITKTLTQGVLYYKNNRVLSKLKVSAGDLIGTIFPWHEKEKNADINKSDTALHFTILLDVKLTKSYTEDYLTKGKTAPLSFFISPCSVESPVKCF